MKQYFKVYLITVLISGICIGLPWLIDLTGFRIGIDAIEILEWQGILSGLIGLAISAVYVIRNVKTWLPRTLILVANPAIYYCLILLCIGIGFASEEWHGFMNPASPDGLSATYDSMEIIASYEEDHTVNDYTIKVYSEEKEIQIRYLDRHKNLISYEIYGYNQNNQKTKCFRYNAANECTHTVTYEYDASGNLLAETTYSADGIGMFRDHYQYDEQNRMLSKTEDTLGGVQQEVVYTFTYSYDEQGRICREDIYAFDELYGYYLYEYDGALQIRKEHYFVGDSEDRYLSGTEYQYDNSGRLVKEIYDEDHICSGYNTIEYQVVICKGGVLHPNTYDCGSFVVN